jgi:hypothetical protein
MCRSQWQRGLTVPTRVRVWLASPARLGFQWVKLVRLWSVTSWNLADYIYAISEPGSRVKLLEADSRARLVRVWVPLGIGLRPFDCCDRGIEYHRGHRCLFVVWRGMMLPGGVALNSVQFEMDSWTGAQRAFAVKSFYKHNDRYVDAQTWISQEICD